MSQEIETYEAPIVDTFCEALGRIERIGSCRRLVFVVTDRIPGAPVVFNTPDPAPFRAALQRAGFYKQWQKKYGPEAGLGLSSTPVRSSEDLAFERCVRIQGFRSL
jgi:hypothetical protein